jgi:beta-mannosidase
VHPEWKRGVPRDAGAGWDFEDVRDHYLKLLYGVDAVDLRYADAERYFELSRLVTGDVMAEVFGEWRRAASPCQGGIILWASDLAPGAGWGILDSQGTPKAAYWFLRRALQPIALWTTDEGLDGVDIHVANDSPVPLDARLRVALYREGERKVGEGTLHIALPAHGGATYGAEYILGRFADAAYAYRFGPPGHDVVAASLYITDYSLPCAQAFRFPLGRPMRRVAMPDLGMKVEACASGDGFVDLFLSARALAYGVRVVAPGFAPKDNYFHLEPGVRRRVTLVPVAPGSSGVCR